MMKMAAVEVAIFFVGKYYLAFMELTLHTVHLNTFTFK